MWNYRYIIMYVYMCSESVYICTCILKLPLLAFKPHSIIMNINISYIIHQNNTIV